MNAGQIIHFHTVTAAVQLAYQFVADSFSEDQDELFIGKVETDGQYVTTTVYYSNIGTYVVEVDSDDLSIREHNLSRPTADI